METTKKHSDILKELLFVPMRLSPEERENGKKLYARIEKVNPDRPRYAEPVFIYWGEDTVAADENGTKWKVSSLIDLEPFGFRNATEDVMRSVRLVSNDLGLN